MVCAIGLPASKRTAAVFKQSIRRMHCTVANTQEAGAFVDVAPPNAGIVTGSPSGDRQPLSRRIAPGSNLQGARGGAGRDTDLATMVLHLLDENLRLPIAHPDRFACRTREATPKRGQHTLLRDGRRHCRRERPALCRRQFQHRPLAPGCLRSPHARARRSRASR
jgi:hypothetical protein